MKPSLRRPAAGPREPCRIHPLGDAALLIEIGSRVDTALNSRALALAAALGRRPDVREAVAGYASVTVHYDPDTVDMESLEDAIRRRMARPRGTPGRERLHRIPVVYDGPDLEEAAAALGIGAGEIVRLHSAPIYRVFMLGFVPGFAYLGPLPPELRLPRRSVPRTAVPAGSVGVAGAQTAVYPFASPGGWHLIGRTHLRLFLPDSDPPTLLHPGDRVRFTPLAREPA
ncbi:MAG: 5-oxoprolinase subunit PxpB [Candidatus Dormibacteraceae bacterium]